MTAKEYAICSMFDKNHDGILDEHEKAHLYDSLKKGFEKTLYFSDDMNDDSLIVKAILEKEEQVMKERGLTREQFEASKKTKANLER